MLILLHSINSKEEIILILLHTIQQERNHVDLITYITKATLFFSSDERKKFQLFLVIRTIQDIFFLLSHFQFIQCRISATSVYQVHNYILALWRLLFYFYLFISSSHCSWMKACNITKLRCQIFQQKINNNNTSQPLQGLIFCMDGLILYVCTYRNHIYLLMYSVYSHVCIIILL